MADRTPASASAAGGPQKRRALVAGLGVGIAAALAKMATPERALANDPNDIVKDANNNVTGQTTLTLSGGGVGGGFGHGTVVIGGDAVELADAGQRAHVGGDLRVVARQHHQADVDGQCHEDHDDHHQQGDQRQDTAAPP